MSLTVTILANGNCTSCCQQETNSVLSRDTSHLLQKLTGSQLVKKFPVFYRTRRFNTALTRARPYPGPARSSPWPTFHFLKVNLNIILPSTPRSSKCLFPSGFPNKTLYMLLLSSMRSTSPAHVIPLILITRTILGEEYRSLSSCGFLHCPITSSLLGPNTIQPIPYWILSHCQMSRNFKSK